MTLVPTWRLRANLNCQSHPYQLVWSPPALNFQGFPAIFLQKDKVGGTLCSVGSVSSFPRVGQRVGQAQESLFPEYTGYFSSLFLGPFPIIRR